ncbi:MAG: CPBP family intramembrane metalloprotease [Lachnospiraceae bacterium]|nr:CPBP family intramembrane metalloprotease [Lachnospiraceae bacterium]
MDMTKQNAKRALTLTTVLTLFVAGFEIFIAYTNYKPGMNFFDLASYVTANRYVYYLILILANMIMLPGAVLLFKESGLSLKDEIFEKKTLGKDIFIGVIALALTGIPSILSTFIYGCQTDMAYKAGKPTIGLTIMGILALGLVSGIVKEIFFRGMAKVFCGSVMGEMTALLLFNVMFAMLDWYNFGLSFVIGSIWIWAYKKSGHLIAPMIAHGGINIISFIYWIMVTG